MFHRPVTGGLDDVQKAGQVLIGIGVRIGQRIAHTSLCREIDQDGRARFLDQLAQLRPLFQIERDEGKAVMRLVSGEPRLLQLDIVVDVKVVHPNDGASFAEGGAPPGGSR